LGEEQEKNLHRKTLKNQPMSLIKKMQSTPRHIKGGKKRAKKTKV